MCARRFAVVWSVVWCLSAPTYAAEFIVSGASGRPGDQVAVSVSLNAQGDQVNGSQNDLHFSAPIAIAARSNGRPLCTLNDDLYVALGFRSFAWWNWLVPPAYAKGPAFSTIFRPQGCVTGVDCSGLRALFLSTDYTRVVQDGAIVYTCTVNIDANARPGDYPLTCDGLILSDPNGARVPNASCRSGVITVLPECGAADCNADGEVTIDELITGINIAQEIQPLDTCAVMDLNGDGAVTIEELVVAYGDVLHGCGGE